MDDTLLPATIQTALRHVGGEPVILDSDLARFFGVETKRLNEAVRRNSAKFDGYSFVLEGFDALDLRSQIATPVHPVTDDPASAIGPEQGLRSQIATSNPRGGRRYAPRVFTEHGVVMAATVLNSDRAVKASRRIIEAFVALKRRDALPTKPQDQGFMTRLRTQMERILEAEIDGKTGKTVQSQTQEFITEGLAALRARLKKSGLANEEIEARILKTLAEADEARARAATEHEMTTKQRMKNQANALRLMIEAEQALSSGEIGVLLAVLKDLGTD